MGNIENFNLDNTKFPNKARPFNQAGVQLRLKSIKWNDDKNKGLKFRKTNLNTVYNEEDAKI